MRCCQASEACSCYTALHETCLRALWPLTSWVLTLHLNLDGAGALLGMISSCYVALYGQARILCVVARDHMLPPVLARISPRLGTPVAAATVMGLATGAAQAPDGHLQGKMRKGCLLCPTEVPTGR